MRFLVWMCIETMFLVFDNSQYLDTSIFEVQLLKEMLCLEVYRYPKPGNISDSKPGSFTTTQTHHYTELHKTREMAFLNSRKFSEAITENQP